MNREVGYLLHRDKQGGGVYGMQLNKVKGLANLGRSSLYGGQSSGCKLLEGESCGGHFLHLPSISTLGSPKKTFTFL